MESDKQMWSRLNAEGHWADASKLYAKTFDELKAQKIPTKEAGRQANVLVRSRFPPQLTEREQRRMAALKEQAALPADEDADPDETPAPSNLPIGSTDFDFDLAWAWTHLGADVSPLDAPSGAAWFLREHGRTAKTRPAFVTMCQKAFSKKGGDDIERNREDRSRQFRLLDNLAREFAGLEK